MNIFIVEDEVLIAEMLKEMMQGLEYTVVGTARSYSEAINFLEAHYNIDLCFLDIDLSSDKSGFDVAAYIANKYPIVFLTSYANKSIMKQALMYKPEAYLVKPFIEADLFTTIEIIKGRKEVKDKVKSAYVIIKENADNTKVLVTDILWLKSENIYVEIYTKHQKFLLRKSLTKVIEDLDSYAILRVHKTYAVNLLNVNAISGGFAYINDIEIPISRSLKEEVIEKFKILASNKG